MDDNMTPNPIPALSGTEIFAEWLTLGHVKNPRSNAPYEYTASDGTFVLWSGTLDFDYHMAYLLECRTDHTSDFLFCYQRHAGTNEITVEWAQAPHQIFGGEWTVDTERALVKRWTDWVYDLRAALSSERER